MKIYFACSIRGGGDTSRYQAIIDAIKKSGGDILSEIFIHDAIHLQGSPLPDAEIYRRDTSWINEADIVIAEVTNPSLGVGYELAYAEQLHKPTLALFNGNSGKKLSAMVAGNPSIQTVTYTDATSIKVLVADFLTASAS